MGLYFFLRIGIFLLAFVGWIVYQLFFKRKAWKEVSNDALAICFFLGVWGLIIYWLY